MLMLQMETEALAIFLNQIAVCSSCKQKFVVCPFVDEETNRSYPFADRLINGRLINGLNRLKQTYPSMLLSRPQTSHFSNSSFVLHYRPCTDVNYILTIHIAKKKYSALEDFLSFYR